MVFFVVLNFSKATKIIDALIFEEKGFEQECFIFNNLN